MVVYLLYGIGIALSNTFNCITKNNDENARCALFVIWLAGIDLKRAIDLLQQYDAAEPVRQGHIRNGKQKIRAIGNRRA